MPVCEGCGTRTDEAHIQSRAERMELAGKYRPTQIRVLFLDSAPPMRMEDYFYRSAADRSVRSLASRMYFDELVKATGAPNPAMKRKITNADKPLRIFALGWASFIPFS